jgi:hypothetical protein
MVHPNTRASIQAQDGEDLDIQSPSGRPKRTVKAPQLFTFSTPNNNDSPSPSKPSAKKKRKKRKKPSERSSQESVEAMRESRAKNLPPSSDEEDDDLHKKPSAYSDLGVLTQYSADGDDGSDSNDDINPNNILALNQDTSSNDDSAARDDIDGQGSVVFDEAVGDIYSDSMRANQFWNAASVGNTQTIASTILELKQERFENGEYYVPPVDPRQYQQFQWQNINIPPVHGFTDSNTAAATVQDPSLLPPPLPTLNQWPVTWTQQPVTWTQQPLNLSPEQLMDCIKPFDQQHGLVNQQAPRQVYHNPYRTNRPSRQVPILPRPPPRPRVLPPRTEVPPLNCQVLPLRPQVPPMNPQVLPMNRQVLPAYCQVLPSNPPPPPQECQDLLLNHQVLPPNINFHLCHCHHCRTKKSKIHWKNLVRASVSPPDPQDAGNGPPLDDTEDSAAAIAHDLETNGLALNPEDAKFLGTVKHGKNSADYIRQQEMVEEKVFDMIKKYGGTAMQILLEKVQIGQPNSQGNVKDYHFYQIL